MARNQKNVTRNDQAEPRATARDNKEIVREWALGVARRAHARRESDRKGGGQEDERVACGFEKADDSAAHVAAVEAAPRRQQRPNEREEGAGARVDARGEPLAWITGVTRFCGRQLRVDAGVYVPRPQSEAMAEMAADRLPPGGTAVDLCTGTGAIAHHLRHRAPGATVIAVDCDIRAVRCATRNGVAALLGDLGAALRSDSFDVVTAVAFVSSGLGLSLGVDSARNLQLPGVTYVPLEDSGEAEFDLCMIYRASEESPLLAQFLATVRDTVGAGR